MFVLRRTLDWLRHATWLAPVLILSLGLPASLRAQDGEEKEEEKAPAEKYSPDQREAIKQLFSASKIEFLKDGRIRIIYQYGRDYRADRDEDVGRAEEDESLLQDWSPPMESTKNRMRWVGRHEDDRDGAIMIAEHGSWLHKAVWKDELKMSFEMVCYSQMKRPDYLVAGIFDTKGKRGIGSNLGKQVLTLSGLKAGKPAPKGYDPPSATREYTYGFHLKANEFSLTRNGKDIDITRSAKKYKTFRAGLRWKGRIQACIHKIILEGTLDDKWLEKTL